MGAIRESDVKAALRALRHGGQLDQSPLLQLNAVVDFCHNQGQPINAQALEWALGQVLTQLVHLQLVRFDPSKRALSPSEQLPLDFGAGDIQREAWSAVYHRYLSPEHLTVAALSRLAGVDAKLFDRRRAKGVELLTEALRTHEARIDADGTSLARSDRKTNRSQDAVQGDDAPPIGDLDAFRHDRLSAWQEANEQLDLRFVELSLLLDQGSDGPHERWQSIEQRFHDLDSVLEAREEGAFVLLGAPGAGKTTLLRHLEMIIARKGLTDAGQPIAFFQSLAACHGRHAKDRPDPGAWLEEQWSRRYPDLPGLDRLADEGAILLLDGLNELPHVNAADFRARLLLWKSWLHDFLGHHPLSRVIIACRTLDYSAPLSSLETPVPHMQVEDMDPERARSFLKQHHPGLADRIWEELESSRQLDLTRSPFYLRLVIDAVVATGEVPTGRAALFTDLVRRSLRRELKRDNPRLLDLRLLEERDLMRIIHARKWGSPYELPDRGPLIGTLSRLAYTLQLGDFHGESRQVRTTWDEACQNIAPMPGPMVLGAGMDLGLLEDDRDHDEVFFRHQLIQEYFAARGLGDPRFLSVPWRAADIQPPLESVLASLAPAEPLPVLPQTGWEETATMASSMAEDGDAFIKALIPGHLALAGRCAAQPDSRASKALKDKLRVALVERSTDPDTDLRARIAAAEALGELGDPRFELRQGPEGTYLYPPLAEIPGGRYPIGRDEGPFPEEAPRHEVELEAFSIGRFPVTNAEFEHFIESGGYEDERWWDTDGARAWLKGEISDAESVRAQLADLRREPERLETYREQGVVDEELYAFWSALLQFSETEADAEIDRLYPRRDFSEPSYWGHDLLGRPSQPVVGTCWYEARAYCNWMSAQCGERFRLPTEPQWEAAARGLGDHEYAFGPEFLPLAANVLETHLRRTTPVGIFPEGDSPFGVCDLTGNIFEWISTLYGSAGEDPEFPYPYCQSDGREDPAAAPDILRIVRGGNWTYGRDFNRVSTRVYVHPGTRTDVDGFRMVRTSMGAQRSRDLERRS